jgi:hypothetical protein
MVALAPSGQADIDRPAKGDAEMGTVLLAGVSRSQCGVMSGVALRNQPWHESDAQGRNKGSFCLDGGHKQLKADYAATRNSGGDIADDHDPATTARLSRCFTPGSSANCCPSSSKDRAHGFASSRWAVFVSTRRPV